MVSQVPVMFEVHNRHISPSCKRCFGETWAAPIDYNRPDHLRPAPIRVAKLNVLRLEVKRLSAMTTGRVKT